MSHPDPLPDRHDVYQRLQTHVQALAQERDPYFAQAGHLFAQTYIQTQWQEWGQTERQTFTVNGRSHHNLILHLPPAQPQQVTAPPIVLGAHYDAVPHCPGADDNASGVAVLLELARYFSQYPCRYPLRCIAFDAEELGLAGSQHYVQQLTQTSTPLRLMLSLEMLGYCDRTPGSQRYPLPWLAWLYPDQADFVGLIGNLPTLPDLSQLSRAIAQAGVRSPWLPAGWRGHLLPATRWSDHAPFWDAGYRAIMVTDTSFLRNPHYHQPSDRLETLDFDFMSRISLGLIAGLRRL